MVREAYRHEIQEFFKLTLLGTLVTPIGTPSSGSPLDNTCIWTFSPKYLWYIGIPPKYLETNHRSSDHPPECYSATENNTWEGSL
jgi:hypothetical protein